MVTSVVDRFVGLSEMEIRSKKSAQVADACHKLRFWKTEQQKKIERTFFDEFFNDSSLKL